MGLFSRRNQKESAVVFVDFEYMQISFKKRFGINPPVLQWYRQLEEKYQIYNIYFFADFSKGSIKYSLPEIRKITSNTIDTQNTASRYKKDFTDFFVLDMIYQSAFEKNSPSTFILFTGDGHFGAVTRFLMSKCKKRVVVYGVEETISSQLKSAASECIAYPDEAGQKRMYYPMMARQMQSMLESDKYRYLTFLVVVKYVFDQTTEMQNPIPQQAIHDTLESMISDGYITFQEQWNYHRRKIRVLVVDWDKLKKDMIL